MKKNILLLIAVLYLFSSCSKSGSSNPYYLTANIAGTSMSFNAALVGTTTTSGGIPGLYVVGESNTTASAQSITILIANLSGGSTAPLGVGTYADSSTVFDIGCTYTHDATAGGTYMAGTVMEGFAQGMSVTIQHPLKVVITAIDKNHVQGTFSGDFFANFDPSSNPKTITNGSFNVKLQ